MNGNTHSAVFDTFKLFHINFNNYFSDKKALEEKKAKKAEQKAAQK